MPYIINQPIETYPEYRSTQSHEMSGEPLTIDPKYFPSRLIHVERDESKSGKVGDRLFQWGYGAVARFAWVVPECVKYEP